MSASPTTNDADTETHGALFQDAIVRFSRNIDEYRLDELVGLFHHDAMLVIPSRLAGPLVGGAEIRDFFAGLFEKKWQGQHQTALAILDGDGDGQVEFSAAFVYFRFEGGLHFQTAGRYKGSFARNESGWRFAQLVVDVQGSAGPA